MAKNVVKDDEMNIVHNDIKKIRNRPTMYISALGLSGVFHIVKEIIDNAYDECYKQASNGDSIEIFVTKDSVHVLDNGRGIPTGILREVFETLQAGSNMLRSGGETRGENGAGSTCALATSSYLKLVTRRATEKKMLTLEYKEAELVTEELVEHKDGSHGFEVVYKPSKKILGVNEIPIDMVVEWLNDFTYTLPNTIHMEYTVCGKKTTVKPKEISEYVSDNITQEQRLSKILDFSISGNLDEVFMGKTYNRNFNADVSIVYSNPTTYTGECLRTSWMNTIRTTQNGSHMDGVIRGFSKFMCEKVAAKNKRLSAADVKRDVVANLNVVVKAGCNLAHMFDAQRKNCVLKNELATAIAKATYDMLTSFGNSTIIDGIVDVILSNYKARIAGEHARTINKATKVVSNWDLPDKYIPCSSANYGIPKELYIVEGNSAGGGLSQARDARFQAIFMSRGKIPNVWNLSLVDALAKENNLLSNLVKIMRCGISDTFDIKKLAFDKIIIETDADIDGYQIRAGYAIMFYKYFPEIIKAGKLYIGEPPLYKLQQNKKIFYVASPTEYVDACINSVKNITIEFTDKNGKPFKVNTADFITNAFEYATKLIGCSISYSINRYLLEYIAYGITKYGKSINKFIDNIDDWIRDGLSMFPEFTFDHETHQILATIDYIDQVVIVDENLFNSLGYVIDVLERYGYNVRYEEKGQVVNTTTLGFFEYVEKLYPVIKDRYKGLGQTDAEVSHEIIMNPATRRIVPVQMNDIDTHVRLAALVGKTKQDIQNRKEFMRNFKYTPDMIDS